MEIGQFLLVMEKLDANPEHKITWKQFVHQFGQTQQNMETLLRLYAMPKQSLRDVQQRSADMEDRRSAKARKKQKVGGNAANTAHSKRSAALDSRELGAQL